MKGRLRQVQRVQRPCGRSRHGIKDVLWTTGRLVCLKVHMEAEAGGSKPTACQGCLKEVCLACGAHREQEEANQAWGCWGGWKACLGGPCRRGPMKQDSSRPTGIGSSICPVGSSQRVGRWPCTVVG